MELSVVGHARVHCRPRLAAVIGPLHVHTVDNAEDVLLPGDCGMSGKLREFGLHDFEEDFKFFKTDPCIKKKFYSWNANQLKVIRLRAIFLGMVLKVQDK